MTRIMILAASAALLAGSASAQVAGQTIRVSTEGKTPVQIRAEVFQAARKLCQVEVPGYAFRVDEARACIDRTARVTLEQSHDPAVRVASR
ncbi:hypothetical protein [Phenylobacterium sp.]|uniref:hypothetical protein n=1 Tax=Phenylobacterium sp. TaxID=1871053 RepID=UPI0012116383|nr:hypothetical protein [Phenylobacterium sp.]THD57612.1 MAG: hypothetical protein E8A49_22515 [Phenylobacterium sp.]